MLKALSELISCISFIYLCLFVRTSISDLFYNSFLYSIISSFCKKFLSFIFLSMSLLITLLIFSALITLSICYNSLISWSIWFISPCFSSFLKRDLLYFPCFFRKVLFSFIYNFNFSYWLIFLIKSKLCFYILKFLSNQSILITMSFSS